MNVFHKYLTMRNFTFLNFEQYYILLNYVNYIYIFYSFNFTFKFYFITSKIFNFASVHIHSGVAIYMK